ncbi:PREDICTED: ankyrin repeat domain-containing protein 49-like [Priapulus caudatus]|uniref:Ankyrin repeat domain-containing protein 49-like n=1 Tax=Priapulus caudatus TaxID=37621 RepID=A0ABM1ESD3_PRICU|nr:PREDICTED: ankyrin repeat domain-containing protein 49-like [Priapulus caudatus]
MEAEGDAACGGQSALDARSQVDDIYDNNDGAACGGQSTHCLPRGVRSQFDSNDDDYGAVNDDMTHGVPRGTPYGFHSDDEDDDYVTNDDDLMHVIPRGAASGFDSSSDDDDAGADDAASRLLRAAEAGDLAAIEATLAADPSLVNACDADGYTPLHRACYAGRPRCVRALLARGADPAAETRDGWRPLHSACRWNSYECASALLRGGADVNARTHGRVTALHLAASHPGARETLELLLLERYVEPWPVNAAGDTPYDVARRAGPHAHLFEAVEDCATCLYEKEPR